MRVTEASTYPVSSWVIKKDQLGGILAYVIKKQYVFKFSLYRRITLNKVLLFLGTLILIFSISGCEHSSKNFKEYLIHGKGEGYEVKNCVLYVYDNGEALFSNGELVVDQEFELLEFEIFQYISNDNKNTIYNRSFTLPKGTIITTEFKDEVIKDKSISIEIPVQSEILLKRNENQGNEEIVELEVLVIREE